MMPSVSAQGALFTQADLDQLVAALASISRNTHATGLDSQVAYLASVAGAVAAEKTLLMERSKMRTVRQYAIAHRLSERTVRHQCMSGALPAQKREGRWVILDMEESAA